MAITFIEELDAAEAEAKRFIKRCQELKSRMKHDEFANERGENMVETGAVKRAAHDLKYQLTNITQFSNYERRKTRGKI